MIVITKQTETNWIPIISAVISFLAVSVAIVSIWLQQWQYNKKREPIISPTTKSFTVELPGLGLDWETNEQLDNKFSNTSIPLYNFGGTTAHNISYSFKLMNLLTLEEQLGKYNSEKEIFAKIDQVNRENDSFDLFIKYNSSWKRFIEIRWFVKRADLISPGEKIDVFLPSYFLVLINYKYRALNRSDDFEMENPILELTVRYSDVNNDHYIVRYQVRLDGQYRVKGQMFEVKGIELTSSFVHEFITKKKIK